MNLEKLYKKINDLIVREDSIELKQEILKEIQVELITNGKVNTGIKKAFNNFVKNSQNRPLFQKIHKTAQCTYGLCDGYKLIEWKDYSNIPKQLLPEVNANVDGKYSLLYDNLKNKDHLEKAIIKIEDLKKVINFQKTQDKEEMPQVYIINDKVWVNPNYLLDVITLAEYKEKEITVEYSREIAPINIELDNCNILVLPIRHSEIPEVCLKITNNFNNIIKNM